MLKVLALNRVSVDLLKKGIWPWSTGVMSRLPDHYRKRYIEKFTKQPQPVHIEFPPEYHRDAETGVVLRRQLSDIPVVESKEQHTGLWGGESIIKGFKLPKTRQPLKRRRVPTLWRPRLIRRIFHSEILDCYMEITVTHRTLDLIDQARGFDSYILKTHDVDLKSDLGMKLKRDMLRTLRTRSMYPSDPDKRQQIYDKYKEFDVLTDEEIDWLGLSLPDAVEKKHQEELAEAEAAVRPLKEIYSENLIARIKAVEASGKDSSIVGDRKSGVLSRLFGSDKKS